MVLERIYTVNLRDAYRKPQYKRADSAMRLLKIFLARHLKAKDDRVRVDPEVNDFVRARGSLHPVKYLKIQATKDKEGMVWAKLVA